MYTQGKDLAVRSPPPAVAPSPIPSYWSLSPSVSETGTGFPVGQPLLQLVCVCLSLARVANINCGPELKVFMILFMLQRFSVAYLFLIPLWNIREWGFGGEERLSQDEGSVTYSQLAGVLS